MRNQKCPSSGDVFLDSRGIIEVSVRDLAQLFNSMDASPFHEKELDRNAEEYIVNAARELRSDAPVAILVHLGRPVGMEGEEKMIGSAIRTHFERQAESARRRLRSLMQRGWINLLIGLTLLTASVIVSEAVAVRMGKSPLATVLGQSLLIGGWVAMSRPMEIFLYDWWSVRAEQRIHQRLARLLVRIIYDFHQPQDSQVRGDRDLSLAGARGETKCFIGSLSPTQLKQG